MSLGVLLMAYGGPDSLDEVPEYLLDVRGGRPMPPAVVEEIRERYRLIGGRSPILALTRAQAAGVAGFLDVPVHVGMRHWHPYIAKAVDEMRAAGITEVVAIPMSPFYSTMSIGAYADRLKEALAPAMSAHLVHSWHLFPPYVEAVAERLREARAGREGARVVFTAHSLPQRLRDAGDPYDGQLRAASAAVAAACGIDSFAFAYQSPGKTPEPWMGPFIETVIKEEAEAGERAFLLVPIGFVCDHVEVLYDIDVVLVELARTLGVELSRSASLNDAPAFVAALADMVRQVGDGRPEGFAVERLP